MISRRCCFPALRFALLIGIAPFTPSLAQADPVEVAFEPPTITQTAICTARKPDELLVLDWAGWTGQTLPDQPPELIRRDLRRLMDLDAVRWFDTIRNANALMPAVDPKYTADKAMLDRIDLLIAAGKVKELTNERLVPQLLSANANTSPRMQNAISMFLMQGIGVAQDRDAGLALLVQAAYGGNADALLKIAQMQQDGAAVPGWDVPSDLAITMAFGALVGQLDPMICDRVARIAREYGNGSIVAQNLALSEKWYRFAADLGDTAAAWKVSELHMRSEEIVKSNDTLLTYLTKAANGGLPYAQMALGRVYEVGGLAPKDTARALELYRAAAQYGDRAGQMRLTLYLQTQSQRNATFVPAYRTALATLGARKDAPSWAFVAQADAVLEDRGRWAGEAAAIVLLQKAAAMNDPDAVKRLMRISYRTADTPAKFYALIDQVVDSVHTDGEIDPMTDLKNAFTCRAPNAPQREEAQYWADTADATGTKTVEFGPDEILQLLKNKDPLDMARLQSQALYGRPTALAQYMALLDRIDPTGKQTAFWQTYAPGFTRVTLSRARIERKFGLSGAAVGDPVILFRQAIAEGDLIAGLDLAETLLQDGNASAEATAALLPLAELGIGKALVQLPIADPARFADLAAVYRSYATAIETRGDFDAILLALPFVSGADAQKDYIARATTTTDCSFDESLRFADAMAAVGQTVGYQKWLGIAEFLAGADAWSLSKLGDSLRKHGAPEDEVRMMAFYSAAHNAGDITATYRMLDRYAKLGTPNYDPALSAQLYVDLVERVKPDDVPRTLARLAAEDPEIRNPAYAKIDVPAKYRAAAEAGSAVAMFEYGKILRTSALTPADFAIATGWIARAAGKGDGNAMLAYSDALAFGIGIDPSRDAALKWLRLAAGAGNKEAAAKLRGLAPPQTTALGPPIEGTTQ